VFSNIYTTDKNTLYTESEITSNINKQFDGSETDLTFYSQMLQGEGSIYDFKDRKTATIYSNSRSEDDMWVLSNYQEIKEPVIADWIRLSSDVTAYNDHKLGTNNTKSWKKYGGFMKLRQIAKDFELE